MKIVILDFDDVRNPLLAAGQARATYEVGTRFARMGHEVVSLCSRYPGSKDRLEDGIYYRHIGLGTKLVQLNNAAYIAAIPYTIIGLKADIIIECFTAPISTLMSPLFTRIPVVALPTVFAADSFSKKYGLPFHLVEAFGCKFYKYFMPYLPTDERKMRRFNRNIVSRMIGQGVDRQYLQIKKLPPRHILFIGRMDIAQKGIDLLLHAYASVSDKIRLPLVIAGHGPDEQKVRELIRKLKIGKRVQFVGGAYGEKKIKLLSRAAFVAMPSRYDNLPLFALEALASGLPLLTFNTDEFSWLTPAFARKASAFSAADYGKKMLELAESPSLDAMGMSARNYATLHTWEKVTEKMSRFFKDILKKEGSV